MLPPLHKRTLRVMTLTLQADQLEYRFGLRKLMIPDLRASTCLPLEPLQQVDPKTDKVGFVGHPLWGWS